MCPHQDEAVGLDYGLCGGLCCCSLCGLSFLYHTIFLMCLRSLSHECNGCFYQVCVLVMVLLWSVLVVVSLVMSVGYIPKHIQSYYVSWDFGPRLSQGPMNTSPKKGRPQPDHNTMGQTTNQTINPPIKTTAHQLVKIWIRLIYIHMLNKTGVHKQTNKRAWHSRVGGMRSIRVTNTVSYCIDRGRNVKKLRRLWRASKIRSRIRNQKLNDHNIYH